jgi:hypothetical protein
MDCIRKNFNVRLHTGTMVTVPVFDTKEMIISILTDKTLMTDKNFAEGYNVHSSDVDPNKTCNEKYGEVHTGDARIPARSRYCQNDQGIKAMLVTLIVFGDKLHTDLHGALALPPVIFTLTLFNQSACNNTNFWRIAYIPNLSYGKSTAYKTKTRHKMQDEHTCLSCAFQSLRKISEEGGFDLVVLGEQVRVRVWIHFFIGDMEGNKKWLGQYPGNREGVQ